MRVLDTELEPLLLSKAAQVRFVSVLLGVVWWSVAWWSVVWCGVVERGGVGWGVLTRVAQGLGRSSWMIVMWLESKKRAVRELPELLCGSITTRGRHPGPCREAGLSMLLLPPVAVPHAHT